MNKRHLCRFGFVWFCLTFIVDSAQLSWAADSLVWHNEHNRVDAEIQSWDLDQLLEKIAAKGPVAIQKVIEAVNAYFMYDEDGFQREMREFGNTTGTADFREGVAAFIEKRKANFKGE